MRRVIVPALLALAMISSAPNASAFGLFDKLCGNGCDAGCDMGCEPVCGCEVAVPTCGCEEPCAPRRGLLSRLFHKHDACDMGCEPACGCEIAAPACPPIMAEPACGCEIAAPACGCDAPAPCNKPVLGLFKRLFHKNRGCDCGCEVIEPACGCEFEPACGLEMAPACGCGH